MSVKVSLLKANGYYFIPCSFHASFRELSLELIEYLFFLKEKEAKILFLQKAIDVVGKRALTTVPNCCVLLRNNTNTSSKVFG